MYAPSAFGSIMIGRLLTFALFASVAVGCAAAAGDEVGSGADDLTESGDNLSSLRLAVKDVEQEHVVLPAAIEAPTADVTAGSKGDGTAISGLDWYQKWAGGKTADHTWSDGSDLGKRCAWASVLRFEAIARQAPPELAALLAAQKKGWDGSFQNWNNDYGGKTAAGEPAYGNASGAYVFAPRSDVAKWVSSTAKDGSCYLPTKSMLLDFLTTCKAQVDKSGDIKGCESPSATSSDE
jgi:hypothetical protein